MHNDKQATPLPDADLDAAAGGLGRNDGSSKENAVERTTNTCPICGAAVRSESNIINFREYYICSNGHHSYITYAFGF